MKAKILDMQSMPEEGVYIVTPFDAAHWLEVANYEHQRPIRQWHVSNLKKEIDAGRFRKKTQVSFCRLNDKYMLINGQHTLTAIKTSGVPCLLSVVIHDVSTMEEVADLYAQEDTHLTRRFADSLVAHEEHIRLGITITEMSWVAAACAYFAFMVGELDSKGASAITHTEKHLLTRKYGELAVSALRLVVNPSGHKNNYANRKTTLGPMMFVFRNDPNLCENFWGEMFKDDGLRVGDPRKTLLGIFRDSTTIGGRSGALGVKRTFADHHLVKAQAVAFNAFVDRRQLKLIKYSHDDRTVEFKGVGTVRV
jgi:hypothetical protein